MKRKWIAPVAALAAALILSSCGAGGTDSGRYNGTDSAPAADSAAENYYGGYEADYGHDGSEAGEDAGNRKIPFNEDPSRRMVYTVEMNLETLELDTGMDELLDEVARIGGYVESCYIYGRSLYAPEAERRVEYTLKVPSGQLADFIFNMRKWYNLTWMAQTSQDITRQYEVVDTTTSDLAGQRARLLERLAAAEDEALISELEQELAALQAEIAWEENTLAQMTHDIAYSDVSVRLYEVDEARVPQLDGPEEPVSFAQRLGDTASDSWDAFVGFCQGFVIAFVAVLPGLVILVVILILVWVLRRTYLKRRALRESGDDRPTPPTTPQPPQGGPPAQSVAAWEDRARQAPPPPQTPPAEQNNSPSDPPTQ